VPSRLRKIVSSVSLQVNSDEEQEEDDDYSDSSSSVSTVDEILDDRTAKLKAAKYVFLTLRQALVNSMVIISVGCLGFWFIEGFSLVDSWYFTTVLLTTGKQLLVSSQEYLDRIIFRLVPHPLPTFLFVSF